MSEESQETDSKRKTKLPRFLSGAVGFLWPMIAFFGASFVVGFILLGVGAATDQPVTTLVQENLYARMLYQLLVAAAILFFVAAPLYKFFFKDTPWQKVFGLAKSVTSSDVGIAIIAFGGYLLTTVAVSALISTFFTGIDLDQAQELGIADPQTILQYAVIFVTLVVIPPIFEELIFRGFMFKSLRDRYSFWVSAVLTSLAFAVVHLQVNVGIDVFILSLFLCYLRERTGGLWAPIFLHAAKNVLAFMLLFVWNVI